MNKDWEVRGEIGYQLDPASTLTKLRRASQGLAFIAQQWGWQGRYFREVGSTSHQRRNLMSASFGSYYFLRKNNPQIADMTIVFSGSGFTDWVEWQGNNIVNQDNEPFVFPGALAQLTPSGLPWRYSPYIQEGSYVYFEETPSIQADFDPEIEYIDSLGLWRAKAKQVGLMTISRLAGQSEIIEYEIVSWNPEERFLEEVASFPDWYGIWGSKGTLATIQILGDLAELHGFTPDNTLRLLGRTVTVDIPSGFDFSDIYVDDTVVGSRRFRGIENRTSSSVRARVSFEPGTLLTPPFEKVEVEFSDGVTPQRLDITALLTDNPLYAVYPSKLNATALLEPWFTPAPRADFVVANDNSGTESKHGFLRLPVDYERDGAEWISANAICNLFALYGKQNDSFEFQSKKQEPVTFYDVSFREPLERKFYQEDYLVSLFRDFDLPEDNEYELAMVMVKEQDEEAGWKQASKKEYQERYSRRIRANFWEGDWWHRIGNEPLTGVLDRDVKEGKLVQLPKTWREYPEVYLPRLMETWEERTNFLIPCYAYAAADLVSADEPVFDIEQ